MVPAQRIPLGPDQAGHTLAAVLRAYLAGRSWNQIRRLVSSRQATVNGTLCFDPARRLAEGDIVEILAQPVPKPRQPQSVVLRHLDEHIVVVEKPAGTATVR